MSPLRRAVLAAVLLAVSSCAAVPALVVAAAANPAIDAAVSALATAVLNFGVTKGLAIAAANSAPELSTVLAAKVNDIEPLVATAEKAIVVTQQDVDAASALAVQINAQVAALAVLAAPAVVVVPKAAP